MGKKEQFPYVGTTYRRPSTSTPGLSMHCSTPLLSRTVCGNQRNAGGGERHRQWRPVTVSSKRGFIRAVAVVTRRRSR